MTKITNGVSAIFFDFDGTLTSTPGDRALRRNKMGDLMQRGPMLKARLLELRKAGFVLGIISKSSESTIVGTLEKAGLALAFGGPIVANAVGLEGKAGFIHELCAEGGALEHLEGRDILLIDDDLSELELAHEAGIQTYAAPEDGGLQEGDFDRIMQALGVDLQHTPPDTSENSQRSERSESSDR